MRRLCVMIVCCLLLALLPGCAGVKEYTRTFFAMDTVITIRLTAQDDQQAIDALDAVQELVSQLEGMWSRTLPDSEVSRLNAGERLSLDDRTARLLVRAADLSEQTNCSKLFLQQLRRLLLWIELRKLQVTANHYMLMSVQQHSKKARHMISLAVVTALVLRTLLQVPSSLSMRT